MSDNVRRLPKPAKKPITTRTEGKAERFFNELRAASMARPGRFDRGLFIIHGDDNDFEIMSIDTLNTYEAIGMLDRAKLYLIRSMDGDPPDDPDETN